MTNQEFKNASLWMTVSEAHNWGDEQFSIIETAARKIKGKRSWDRAFIPMLERLGFDQGESKQFSQAYSSDSAFTRVDVPKKAGDAMYCALILESVSDD